jgi:hypothetical protein
MPSLTHGITLRDMRAYVLAEIGDRLAVDVLLRREDAWDALEELLEDDPGRATFLYVAPIELDERDVSLN